MRLASVVLRKSMNHPNVGHCGRIDESSQVSKKTPTNIRVVLEEPRNNQPDGEFEGAGAAGDTEAQFPQLYEQMSQGSVRPGLAATSSNPDNGIICHRQAYYVGSLLQVALSTGISRFHSSSYLRSIHSGTATKYTWCLKSDKVRPESE